MPETSDSATKSATDSIPLADLGCVECGHDVVTDLSLNSLGTYLEVACTDAWACLERCMRIPA